MDRNNFEPYMKVFLEENSKINLISKNEEKYLYEKHITDSLAISTFFDKYIVPETLLDIGTGGGFPAVPVAVAYPDIQVWAIDSIAKKIRAIENIKQKLDLENLYPVCSRIENFKEKTFDVVTSRALASLDKLFLYAAPLLKDGGYFVAYKSRLLEDELKSAQKIMKKNGFVQVDTIEYTLPTAENHVRRLAIFKKN